MTTPAPTSASSDSPRPSLSEALTSAVGFWEPRRLHYNLVLLAIVIWRAFKTWPALRDSFTFPSALILFILAVLANVCYSAAYLPDTVLQLSGFRARWLQLRWRLWLVGTLFAAAITFLLTMNGLTGQAQ